MAAEDLDLEAAGSQTEANATSKEGTEAIASETKDLIVEAKSSLVVLICTILIMSLLSILLSTWLAKTITNSPSSFSSILGHYFGFDRNESESSLTWWHPIHLPLAQIISIRSSNMTNATETNSTQFSRVPPNNYPHFQTIALPFLFIGSFFLAILAFYARVKCTDRNFAWGAVPKLPFDRVDPSIVLNKKQAEPGMDYTIVQGTKQDPVVFALAETLQPLNETVAQEPGKIVDEGTQYELTDIPKTITHVSSAPQLNKNEQ